MQTLSPSNQKVSEKPPVNEEDGWLEVGKKNKAVVTRSVCDKMIYSILRLFVFMCFMT